MSGDDPVGAADFRRALALIQHGERGDVASMRVVLDDEVIPLDRLAQLIRATVSILWQLASQLCEADELAEIGAMLTVAATVDEIELDDDNRLVARIAMAQHSEDLDAENEVLRDAAATPDGLVRLALTTAGVVSAMLPQLRTAVGRQLLNNLAMDALRAEHS